MDRSARGRLRFEGRDAASFLHGLLTNDILALHRGAGAYAALLTPQGRLVTDLRVYHRVADVFVADVPPGMAGELAVRFDSMIFAEDVRVADVSAATGIVTVVGRTAAELLASTLVLAPAAREALGVLAPLAQCDADGGAFVVRADDADWPMFDVWLPASASAVFADALTAAGAPQVSTDLIDALRIDAARPAFGFDMTAETIPLEAGLLERAISTTKGCYVGQEVIIRVLHRGGGRVARRLAQIAFERGAPIMPGQSIRTADLRGAPDDAMGRPVGSGQAPGVDRLGRVTSVAFSPRLDRTIALGYVPRDHAEPGVRVSVESLAGPVEGEILRLAG